MATPKSIWTNPIHFIAFGFGSGAMPKAPGTWGTVVGVVLYYGLSHFSLPIYATITIASFIIGIWICGKTAKDIGVHDHPGIVWDEIVGYFITMFALPNTWPWMLAGFILFRFFDILKPPPINLLETKLKGGLAIMADDVLAGVFAWVVLLLVYLIFS